MKVLRILSITTLLLLATPVFAQLDTGFLGTQAGLTVEPEFPQPGETTKVSLAGLNSQIFSSDLVWTLNGQVIGDANNQREVEFIAGDIGTTDNITVSIISPSGATQTYTAPIRPTYVDIILEPQTRTPDFYQGRALPSIGSQINATVLVNNGELLQGNYSYIWRINNTVINGGPIRGTNQVSFDTPRGSQPIISVEVTDVSGKILGRRTIYFNSVKPEMAFYEINALYGQSHNAIDKQLVLVGPAATVVAEPYYLDIRTYNNPDINEWEIDRQIQPNTNANPYQITVQKVGEGGTSRVSFHVRSTTELLQGVEDSIKIVF